MAAYTLKRLVDPTQLPTSATSIYTVGQGITTAIKEILVANASAANASITIHIAKSGTINSQSNQIVPSVVVSPNSVLTLDITQVMNEGDKIYAYSSIASSLNIMISGYEAQ